MTTVTAHPPPHPPSTPASADGGPTDHELLLASLTRPEAFAEIFERHAAEIHRYLGRRVGDLADDLLSEAFLTAFRKRADYRAETVDVRPWLYGIAANLVRRHHREETTRYKALARTVPDVTATEEWDAAGARVDAQRLGPALATALAEIEERDREVLLLVAWGDLSYADVSAALDIPLGTVRSRLHRARRQVQAHLVLTTQELS